jgi:hypothetical protein
LTLSSDKEDVVYDPNRCDKCGSKQGRMLFQFFACDICDGVVELEKDDGTMRYGWYSAKAAMWSGKKVSCSPHWTVHRALGDAYVVTPYGGNSYHVDEADIIDSFEGREWWCVE